MPTEPRHERTTFRMNVVREASSLQTPLELPDFIRDSFDVVLATTCKFNPFGTLLAVGSASGQLGIWDMNSLTQAATLEFGLDRLNQIDWSDDGYFVVVTSEKTVTRVQLLQPDEQRDEFSIDATMESVTLNGATHECILSRIDKTTLLLDFAHNRRTRELPIFASSDFDACEPLSKRRVCYSTTLYDRNRHRMLYATRERWITVYDSTTFYILDLYALPLGSRILGMRLDRNVDSLVVFLEGRCPAIYEIGSFQPLFCSLPFISNEQAKEIMKHNRRLEEGSVLWPKPLCLTLKHRLKHPFEPLNHVTWDVGCFISSPEEAEFIVCALSCAIASPFAEQHLLHIWNLKTGELDRILEGPKESVRDLDWHPRHGSLISVSESGKVYIWSKRRRQYWSTFDPGFQELEENEEYVESETEFDLPSNAIHEMEIDEDDVPMDNERIDDEILDVFEPLPRFTTDADTSQALLYLPIDYKFPARNMAKGKRMQSEMDSLIKTESMEEDGIEESSPKSFLNGVSNEGIAFLGDFGWIANDRILDETPFQNTVSKRKSSSSLRPSSIQRLDL